MFFTHMLLKIIVHKIVFYYIYSCQMIFVKTFIFVFSCTKFEFYCILLCGLLAFIVCNVFMYGLEHIALGLWVSSLGKFF